MEKLIKHDNGQWSLVKSDATEDYAADKVNNHWHDNAHHSWRQMSGSDHPHGVDMRAEQNDHIKHFQQTGKLKDIPNHFKKPVPETQLETKTRQKRDKKL